ncbi:hypothetical protein GCM10023322_52140 [Rugosimonospora acidiphila]|uniref:Phospholipase D-like domain-containing protein n=1 Tax=Rugosimonospora acidiphila TaxID=556531 RepID=A0ABP9S9M3_9ACTN
MRTITTKGNGQTRALSDLMQNLLVSELLYPSRELWVLSPWIADIVVIDNGAAQFSTLLPGLPARGIRLTEVLIELAQRGSEVRVLTLDDVRNTTVQLRLRDAAASGPHPLHLIRSTLHAKGILGDRFHLSGSMNFTYRGQQVNDEGITVTTEPDIIAKVRIDYNTKYKTK